MNLNLPQQMTAAAFLDEYWQKRPLLIRQALPDYRCPLDGDELAGLALEEQIESRIVLEKDGVRPWQAEQGPFNETRFETLPESHWTLLVQDVEKHIPKVSELLDAFGFLPDWRLDDIMISYAADQGSVGPHIDDYDVFLLQAAGQRRWQIEEKTRSETEYIPGIDLRILPDFNPTQDWILEPGDLLYLPPNIPHWGLAEGDGCITCSVGYRAPALKEMVIAWCDQQVQTQVPAGRYRDPHLQPAVRRAELEAEMLDSIRDEFTRYLHHDPTGFMRWFGRYVTEPKSHLQVEPAAVPLEPLALIAAWRKQEVLERNGWSKFLFHRDQGNCCYLFVSGQEFRVADRQYLLADWLCSERRLYYDQFTTLLEDSANLSLVASLYNGGHLYFHEQPG